MTAHHSYSRWDGTQEPEPFDPTALFDLVADRLLAGEDPWAALRAIFEHGLEGLVGLRELLLRLESPDDQLPRGDPSLVYGVERLVGQLRAAIATGRPAEVDGELVQQLLGLGSGRDLQRLQALVQVLEAAGLVRVHGDRIELTAEGVRRIGRKALLDVFARLRPGWAGSHRTRDAGASGDGVEDTRRYQPGDDFRINLARTLKNALQRRQPRPRLRLEAGDFEVHRTERLARCSTVLLLDVSRSMLLRGYVAPAKKVAIALEALIRAAYPTDEVRVVGFADRARELAHEELVRLDYNQFVYGTNLQHALLVARRILAQRREATRQIILITDGEPTAHFERGEIRFAYPPTFQTFRETLREVARCTREGITINTFMLERSRHLLEFVERMGRINHGRTFVADPARLGEYVLVDYVTSHLTRAVRA